MRTNRKRWEKNLNTKCYGSNCIKEVYSNGIPNRACVNFIII